MAEPGNVAEYTVSEISMALKRTVEDTYSYVRVRGEISGFKGQHSSGHCYFTLKDDKARLEAVCWRLTYSKLKFRPEEGLDVIVTGKLTTFPGSSKYQIVIDQIEPAGVGALMALLEERRRRLAAEGLFDEARKKRLPYLPRVIGVVTSPTGAVIRDILHRLTDRFPVGVLVWPVRVQGETSAAEVAAAIRGFNALQPGGRIPRPDLLIVARGGGSLEDLWSFNDEDVVRAAAASTIPLISAVGHETDWTLLDHVADRRAPTPTGAAEMAVPVRSELLVAVDALARRHAASVSRQFEQMRRALVACARAMPSAENLLGIPRRRLDDFASRLTGALVGGTHTRRTSFERAAGRLSVHALVNLAARDRRKLDVLSARGRTALDRSVERQKARVQSTAARLSLRAVLQAVAQERDRLAAMAARLQTAIDRLAERRHTRVESVNKLMEALSYRGILARGFALVTPADSETPIRAAASVATGAALKIEFHDGRINAVAGGKAPKRRPRTAANENQGDLF